MTSHVQIIEWVTWISLFLALIVGFGACRPWLFLKIGSQIGLEQILMNWGIRLSWVMLGDVGFTFIYVTVC